MMGDASQSQGHSAVFTVREAVMRGTDFLARHDVRSARLDAELIIAHVLETDRLHVYLNMDQPLTEAERSASRDLLVRRAKREPLAYILKTRDFMGRVFSVCPGVLIPRPETELLLEWAHDLLPATFPDEAAAGAWRVLELGCGSGCICVSFADTWRDARVTATDISPIAIAQTCKNAETFGVSDRIEILQQADFAGLPDAAFHAIISNPPYIADGDRESLMPEVRDHEPPEALFAGADGLDVVRMMLAQAPRVLRKGGVMLLEIGCEQGALVAQLPTELEFVELRKDYAGLDRMALWRMKDFVTS